MRLWRGVCLSHMTLLRQVRAFRGQEIRQRQEAWEEERKRHRPEITGEEVAFIVARWTGIPVMRIRQTESERLVHMEDELHERIVGQQDAIEAISRAIRRSRAGLRHRLAGR